LGSCKRIIVLCDTNFLIQIAEGLVSPTMILEALESSYNLVIPVSVIRELELLHESSKMKTRREASRVLYIINNKIKTIIIGSLKAENADDDLILLATQFKKKKCKVYIATSDRELRRRARMLGIPTLYYREGEGILEADWEQV